MILEIAIRTSYSAVEVLKYEALVEDKVEITNEARKKIKSWQKDGLIEIEGAKRFIPWVAVNQITYRIIEEEQK